MKFLSKSPVNTVIIIIIIIAFGTIGASSESFVSLLKSLTFNNNSQNHTLSKLINTTIRCTYYIFCCHNKPWTNPDLSEP